MREGNTVDEKILLLNHYTKNAIYTTFNMCGLAASEVTKVLLASGYSSLSVFEEMLGQPITTIASNWCWSKVHGEYYVDFCYNLVGKDDNNVKIFELVTFPTPHVCTIDDNIVDLYTKNIFTEWEE